MARVSFVPVRPNIIATVVCWQNIYKVNGISLWRLCICDYPPICLKIRISKCCRLPSFFAANCPLDVPLR